MRVLRRVITVVVVIATAACSGAAGPPTTTSSATTTSSSSLPSTTQMGTTSSTSTTALDPCEPSTALRAADAALTAARLEQGGGWSYDVAGAAFVDRTVSADEFGYRLALDCGVLAVQRTGAGAERLLVSAWTGDRLAYAIQATDGPASPYDDAVRVDLLIEQPWGEWVADGVWAVTLSTGESVILGIVDFNLGVTAKSWLVAFPEPPGADPETSLEEYVIDVLERAGARNVGLAEPSHGTVAVIAYSTPLGNVQIATVGEAGSFDPLVPVLSGETSVERIGDVDLRVTLPGPDEYSIADVGFVCGPYGWRLESGFGTAAEVRDWAVALIDLLAC